MTSAQAAQIPFVETVRTVGAPDGFADITRPGVSGVVWNRAFPSAVERTLDDLPADQLRSADCVFEASNVAATISDTCDDAGIPHSEARVWLENDIAVLAATLAVLMQTSQIRLRIDVISNDACQKFHIDNVRTRLICTYRGPGTQYGFLKGDAPPGPVSTVPTGAPFLLRGKKWPTAPVSTLRHRSPPIEGSGQTRLVVVLDPREDWG